MTTAEALAKKGRVRAGHRASASRMIRQVEDALGVDPTKLPSLKRSLEKKLETLKTLDGEIVELIDDGDKLAEEIEHADTFKETIYDTVRSTGPRPRPRLLAPPLVTPLRRVPSLVPAERA